MTEPERMIALAAFADWIERQHDAANAVFTFTVIERRGTMRMEETAACQEPPPES